MKYLEGIKKFIENKMVFCGIDIHKLRWVICYYCDGQLLEKVSIPGDVLSLYNHTRRLYSSARSVQFVYEAGFSGFTLCRQLKKMGYYCMITPPNRIPSDHGKVKTDKRDAEKLAMFFAGGLLKSIYVPPSSVEADRQLIRDRHSSQKKLTRVKNQIKSLLNLLGVSWSADKGRKWTKAYLRWLESVEFEEANFRYILDQHLKEYQFYRSQISELTRRLRKLSTSDKYAVNFKRLTSCKGVGLITAMTYLLELHDVTRFSSSKQLSSYLGLTPSQHSSGEHVRLGHITREGNSHVRRALVESAWTVIRHDPVLRDKYNRIRAKGSNGKKAIVAVARSLAIRLRRCLLDETPYVIGVC
jgi:transposase